MDMIWFTIGTIIGYLLGRTNKPDPSKGEEHLQSINQKLEEDIAYYKKLTRKLVEENTELRKNV